MKTRNLLGCLFLAMAAAIAAAAGPALAHRFNVTLVVPPSNGGALQGQQIRDGFMLATSERDGHPDQESDGHLGGLDVYVTVIGGQGDIAAEIERSASLGKADIVAVFGPEETLSLAGPLREVKGAALLLPGQTPFSKPGLPAVAAFISAYEREYGRRPTPQAAQGYNAARRIDVAVRAQGGAGDTASLRRVFAETARGFAW
jgi:hypothetical protein